MSNFDDKNFSINLMYEKRCQNLTDKMFINFGIEFTEVSKFFELSPQRKKNQYPQQILVPHIRLCYAVNHSALASFVSLVGFTRTVTYG